MNASLEIWLAFIAILDHAMLKNTIFLFLLFLYNCGVFGQNSFVKTLDLSALQAGGLYGSFMGIGSGNGDLSLMIAYTSGCVILELTPFGEILHTYSLSSGSDAWMPLPNNYNRKGAFHASSMRRALNTGNPSSAVFVTNFNTAQYWAVQLSYQAIRFERQCFNSTGQLLTTQFIAETSDNTHGELALSLLNSADGTPIWSNVYAIAELNFSRSIYPIEIKELPNGHFSILCQVERNNSVETYSFLLEIDQDGQVVRNLVVDHQDFGLVLRQQSADASGNIYLSGYTLPDSTSTQSDAVFIKLAPDLSLLWSKRLYAEMFPYDATHLQSDANEGLYFAYSTQGDFPVLAGKMDNNGDLDWYHGYAAYSPRLLLNEARELFIASRRKYLPDGTYDNTPVLIKTRDDGLIDNCETYDACLEQANFELEFSAWQVTPDATLHPFPIPITVTAQQAGTANWCNAPPRPSPFFYLPDTVCVNQIVVADSLKNAFANANEWHIRGLDLDTTSVAPIFSWSFPTPGNYSISQTTWVLGCADTYSKNIHVLSDQVTLLGDDRTLCEAPSYVLAVNRPLLAYTWDNADHSPTRTITTSGEYSLRANDAYCTYSDTVSITFVKDLLPGNILQLPADTSLCLENLPFVLRPQSEYSSSFQLDDALPADRIFSLNNPGNYQVSTNVLGCTFSEFFQLSLDACLAPVYFPNAFSPNHDGINDEVIPQGQDFKGIVMEVYDRWGSLVYQAQEAPFSWNGQSNGQDLPLGVYLVLFQYQNQRTGHVQRRSQDVLLLR
jgi:gliding motility-associated-like protein